jgi:hypothetical protein
MPSGRLMKHLIFAFVGFWRDSGGDRRVSANRPARFCFAIGDNTHVVHAAGPIRFRFFAQTDQSLICVGMQSQQSCQHKASASKDHSVTHVPLVMRGCIDARTSLQFEQLANTGLRFTRPQDRQKSEAFVGGAAALLDLTGGSICLGEGK